MANLPLKKRTRVEQQTACVDEFLHAKATRKGNMRNWMPRFLRDLGAKYPDLAGSKGYIAQGTLYRWAKQVDEHGDASILVDKRGTGSAGVRGESLGDAEAWSFFRDEFLRASQPTKIDCWKATDMESKRQGWAWCGYDSCRRQLDDRILPEVQMFHRDHDRWLKEHQPTIGQDPESFAANEMWVSDQTPLDQWCRVVINGEIKVVRPVFTSYCDWRTRKIVGWRLAPFGDSSTILQALRMAIFADDSAGLPMRVKIDNGSDYDSFMFMGVTKSQRLSMKIGDDIDALRAENGFPGIYKMLSISVHHSIAFTPNGKARKERRFGHLHTSFDKHYPGYCGRSPDNKPASFDLDEFRGNPDLLPSIDDLRGDLAEWVDAFNDRANHQIADLVDEAGIKLSPNQAMARWAMTRRMPVDDASAQLILQHWHSKPVTIGRNGIKFARYGLPFHYGWLHPAIKRWRAVPAAKQPKSWITFDPDDARTIRLFDADLRFVAELPENDMGGAVDAIGRERVKELSRRQRAHAKSLRDEKSNRPSNSNFRPGQMLRHGEAAPKKEPQRAVSFMGIETPLDGQAKAVEEQRIRKAAGAENFTPTYQEIDMESLIDFDHCDSACDNNDDPLDMSAFLGDAAEADIINTNDPLSMDALAADDADPDEGSTGSLLDTLR